MTEQMNGSQFWDGLCGPQSGSQRYPEYVSPDNWFGEYVFKLEQEGRSTPEGDTASPSSMGASSEAKSPVAKLPRWKRRTPEQIEANKAAQKRFRERKKAKQQVAADRVNELSEQMKRFEGLRTEVDAMEAENNALESSLWSKEAELNRIKTEVLDERTPQVVYDNKAQARCFSTVFKGPSLDERIDTVCKRWLKERQGLEEMLQSKGLEPSKNPRITSAIQKELEKRALAAIALCMEVMTLGGPQLEDLLRTVRNREEDLQRQSTARKYAELASFLCLSDEQARQLVDLRTDILTRLGRLYMDRQGLNMQLMALLMAPPPSAVPVANGLKEPQERATEVRAALNKLQENLREEQRLESEHHYAVFRRILTPLQGAWFIAKAYPSHCDTLAFMHGVANMQK